MRGFGIAAIVAFAIFLFLFIHSWFLFNPI
jgi:hypothetical protein